MRLKFSITNPISHINLIVYEDSRHQAAAVFCKYEGKPAPTSRPSLFSYYLHVISLKSPVHTEVAYGNTRLFQFHDCVVPSSSLKEQLTVQFNDIRLVSSSMIGVS